MTESRFTSDYALGSTDAEHERLIRQASLLAPAEGWMSEIEIQRQLIVFELRTDPEAERLKYIPGMNR